MNLAIGGFLNKSRLKKETECILLDEQARVE